MRGVGVWGVGMISILQHPMVLRRWRRLRLRSLARVAAHRTQLNRQAV